MRAMLHRRFGAAREVLQLEDLPTPTPGPDEILVRVRATSVNPIDCAVRRGYGTAYFRAAGIIHDPHIPGRDIAGEVVAAGENVSAFRPGDAVWSAVMSGASAEYALAPAAWAAPMPKSLDWRQAAAFPFAGLTAWTALVVHCGLTPENTPGKKIIIPRGAGGVGSYAIQLMKAWGAEVATIVSSGNVALAHELGADVVVDHTRQDFADVLHDYDVAFDTSFDTEERLLNALKQNADAAYVSVVTPRMKLTDELGMEAGIAKGSQIFAERVSEQAALGRRYFWSFAKPDGAALSHAGALFEAGQLRSVIDSVHALEDLAAAHEVSEAGKARGKIVVDVG
jgi:reticulon-4-interacting protein 1, mitochondrial